ncbi:hypothetical protein RN001_005336 [Aquatica leii]|uniref:(3R)-3-hydroxyacyl-CoA dehydrogenase n=1 Tax=Aquatica leii TaxID=1421715 RepID=A0AAN7SHU1_9COLE|nr:hypothetical protein RN001_005336 [Aquatica leii]
MVCYNFVGGGSGIGRATCQVLAREGASIIAADRNIKTAEDTVSQLLDKKENEHCSVHIDVSESKSVKEVLQEVLRKYNRPPTIIVNCAGITKDNFLLKMSEQDFEDVVNVNLKGTFLVTQTFAKAIIEKGLNQASIINISSIAARNGNIGQSNYSASKAGVELLTKTAAKELAQFGIRCNVVIPGFINTPIVNTIPPELKNRFIANISCKRMGEPQEVAEVITFLASEKSSYINSASIEVCGGLLSL